MRQTRRWFGLLSSLGILGCSGSSELGQANPSEPAPGKAGALRRFASTRLGMCGLFEDGRTYCWGREGSTRPEHVVNLDGIAVSSAGGTDLVCAVRAGGQLACALNPETPLKPQLGFDDAVDVTVGGSELCTLGADGSIRHRFIEGCRGDGDPRPIRLPSPAIEVRCADQGCCAATEDGRLFCFAGSALGQCDVAFEEVPGIRDAVGVSMTMEGACVLHADGQVSCTSGQRSTVTLLPDLSEFAAVGISDVVQLRSSRIATCGLTRSGTLLCWGTSQCGALGISENCGSTAVTAPLAVQQDLQTRLFGMSESYTCALDANADVWCWGLSGWTGAAQGSPVPRRIEF